MSVILHRNWLPIVPLDAHLTPVFFLLLLLVLPVDTLSLGNLSRNTAVGTSGQSRVREIGGC